MYVHNKSSLKYIKYTLIHTNTSMSKHNTQYQIRNYSDRQKHMYNTHQTLYNLTTRIDNIYSDLIRTSSELLHDRTNKQIIQHTEQFGCACRNLHASIQHLASTNHDLSEFLRYLVPFNAPLPPPHSPASSLADSEPSSNPSDFPGGLFRNQIYW